MMEFTININVSNIFFSSIWSKAHSWNVVHASIIRQKNSVMITISQV